MDHFAGLPPLICRELCFRYDFSLEDLNTLSLSSRYTFGAYLKAEFQKLLEGPRAPYLLLKNGAPWDYTYLPIFQYGTLVDSQRQESFSALLDGFYAKKDAAARMKSKSQATLKTVTNLRNRTARKLGNQRKELAGAADRDLFRIRGELITANLYRMERGQTKLIAENYYDPALKEVEIPLNPTLSPQQNAAKYFNDYNKAKNAEQYLTEQIAKGRNRAHLSRKHPGRAQPRGNGKGSHRHPAGADLPGLSPEYRQKKAHENLAVQAHGVRLLGGAADPRGKE